MCRISHLGEFDRLHVLARLHSVTWKIICSLGLLVYTWAAKILVKFASVVCCFTLLQQLPCASCWIICALVFGSYAFRAELSWEITKCHKWRTVQYWHGIYRDSKRLEITCRGTIPESFNLLCLLSDEVDLDTENSEPARMSSSVRIPYKLLWPGRGVRWPSA